MKHENCTYNVEVKAEYTSQEGIKEIVNTIIAVIEFQ